MATTPAQRTGPAARKEHLMIRLPRMGLLVTLCAALAALAPGWQPPAAALQQGPGPGVAFLTVQGRLIRVEFHLASQPPAAPDPGGLLAAVRLSTADPRGLPTDLRPAFLNVIRQSALVWHTPLTPAPTFAWDPRRTILISPGRGPQLPAGSRADTALILRDTTQAYRVSALAVPVASHY